jgi:hypothetical protein
MIIILYPCNNESESCTVPETHTQLPRYRLPSDWPQSDAFFLFFFLFFFSKWDLIVLSTRLNLLDIKWDLIFSLFFPGWIFYVLWTFYFLKSFKILKLVFLGFSNIAKWWVRENMNIQGKMDALIQFFFITLSTLMIKLIIRVY